MFDTYSYSLDKGIVTIHRHGATDAHYDEQSIRQAIANVQDRRNWYFDEDSYNRHLAMLKGALDMLTSSKGGDAT